MNQDSSFPPMLPPSTELGALLFAVLPCLQETYRPLASFAYHMTELTRLKSIPSMPSLSGIADIDALITDKDIMLRSLSFYGKMFRMPLLSTIATLLQGMQFYRAYKDILPGLFSAMGDGGDPSAAFGNMAGLFSGLGGLSPDLLSSLFSGFSGSPAPHGSETSSAPPETTEQTDEPPLSADPPVSADISDEPASETQTDTAPSDDALYDTLYSFLTPEQQKIYDQLMHTD